MEKMELVKSLYEAYANEDIDTFVSLMSDDVVFKLPGSWNHSGTYNGIQEVLEKALPGMASNLPGLKPYPNQFWQDGDTIFAKVDVKSPTLDYQTFHVIVVSGDKIVFFEAWDWDTHAMSKAFNLEIE